MAAGVESNVTHALKHNPMNNNISIWNGVLIVFRFVFMIKEKAVAIYFVTA